MPPGQRFSIGHPQAPLQRGTPVFEGAHVGHCESGGRPLTIVKAQDINQLSGGPHVGQALDAVSIGIEGGSKSTLIGQEVA